MKDWILPALIILIGLCILLYIRKSHAIHRVRAMSTDEKLNKIHQVSAPLGFEYKLNQDIFTSRHDAWQQDYGYCWLYDLGALHFNMVFDCEPIYFDYEGCTWLVEFWKGQYGITTGAEIGIYKADSIISEDQREQTYFHQISDTDMPVFSFTLLRGLLPICRLCAKHWWLTGFLVGRYTEPEYLTMKITITFSSPCMCRAFSCGMLEAGYTPEDMYINESSIAFTFSTPHRRQPRHRHYILNTLTQCKNQLLLACFYRITRPFIFTLDRLLLLYEYMPFLFRHALKIQRTTKRRRHS